MCVRVTVRFFSEELFRRDVMIRNLTNGFLGMAHDLIMCRCYDLCSLERFKITRLYIYGTKAI